MQSRYRLVTDIAKISTEKHRHCLALFTPWSEKDFNKRRASLYSRTYYGKTLAYRSTIVLLSGLVLIHFLHVNTLTCFQCVFHFYCIELPGAGKTLVEPIKSITANQLNKEKITNFQLFQRISLSSLKNRDHIFHLPLSTNNCGRIVWNSEGEQSNSPR